MPRDYSYVVPHFFSKMEDIQRLINEDSTNHKWLVYIPYISEGKEFCKGLEHSYCMLNGKEPESHPEKWYEILEQQKFSEKTRYLSGRRVI